MAAQDPMYFRENYYLSSHENIPTSVMPDLKFKDITPLEFMSTIKKNDLSQIDVKPKNQVQLRESTKDYLKELEEF